MDHESRVIDVTVVERDASKWWAGTKYQVRLRLAESGWSTDCAATFVMDISDAEETSPGSSSPWSGWVGWYGEGVIVTWINPEVETHGVRRIPKTIAIDDEPTENQFEFLAQLVTTTCFESDEAGA